MAFQILCQVYATNIAMFRWDLTLPVDLYSDASNFATVYYITQTQNRETRSLIYDLCSLLLAE